MLCHIISKTRFVIAVLLLTGCSSTQTTSPSRSATEQLLLSTSADRAIHALSLSVFAGKKVFVDGTNYFDSYDAKYVIGSIRDALSQAGALLVNVASNSDITVEPRSGGLSIDNSSTLVGLAQTGLPIPLAGVINIPELALYKSTRQRSYAKLALLAYATHTLEHVYSSGALLGKSRNTNYKLLFVIQWTATDIPEKERKH